MEDEPIISETETLLIKVRKVAHSSGKFISRRTSFLLPPPSGVFSVPAVLLIILLAGASLLYFLIHNPSHVSTLAVLDGQLVNIKAETEDGLFFMRYNTTQGSLFLADRFPRLATGLFRVSLIEGGFKLSTADGNGTVAVNEEAGVLYLDTHSTAVGACFSAIVPYANSTEIRLRSCSADEKYVRTEFDSIQNIWRLTLQSASSWFSRLFRLHRGVFIELIEVPQVHGVNLGGWFIPEVWMNPAIFAGTGLGWGGSLCALVNYSRIEAETRMRAQLDSWITEDDFREIASVGFNSVRLPIGYWNIMPDPYGLYAPADYRVSLQYVDYAFDMAEKYGLTVLLDLHGAPGSQNAIDHSGCGFNILGGPPRWTSPRNVKMTLEAIRVMAERYTKRKNLLGIELMNEPAQSIEEMRHNTLRAFYEAAYKIIRSYSDTTLVVFNELYERCYGWWNDAMQEPHYYNIVVDYHLYDWMMIEHANETAAKHIEHASRWGDLIANKVRNATHSHPIIVGEWCMSTGELKPQVGQPFVDATVDSFRNATGWYMWNWKIERGVGFDEWDVQLQYRKRGILPRLATPPLILPSGAYSGSGSLYQSREGGDEEDRREVESEGLDPLKRAREEHSRAQCATRTWREHLDKINQRMHTLR